MYLFMCYLTRWFGQNRCSILSLFQGTPFIQKEVVACCRLFQASWLSRLVQWSRPLCSFTIKLGASHLRWLPFSAGWPLLSCTLEFSSTCFTKSKMRKLVVTTQIANRQPTALIVTTNIAIERCKLMYSITQSSMGDLISRLFLWATFW